MMVLRTAIGVIAAVAMFLLAAFLVGAALAVLTYQAPRRAVIPAPLDLHCSVWSADGPVQVPCPSERRT